MRKTSLIIVLVALLGMSLFFQTYSTGQMNAYIEPLDEDTSAVNNPRYFVLSE
jgi:hypothetical protein